ncbi:MULTISPECIES: hypothetical protein [unclassified Colwellia]|nr:MULTISPECIES: hypothetical protein [unclassified Colwellia]MBA6231876.1 hypothetical protein [Colwellia sp. MB02u-7]MBA6235951.1 hypothetical protein [Colwellia sp. MB02u-11]MBA6255213.1 hypothetical protein [Colwellia sp. MB3u-28]MBA6258622.1 hypothetical protein [Colwellia sp. MB3u-41]MBA6298633.1 hypothetical protein [Colwellia sp. MB3u-22]
MTKNSGNMICILLGYLMRVNPLFLILGVSERFTFYGNDHRRWIACNV